MTIGAHVRVALVTLLVESHLDNRVSWVRILPSQLFFLLAKKRVVLGVVDLFALLDMCLALQ